MRTRGEGFMQINSIGVSSVVKGTQAPQRDSQLENLRKKIEETKNEIRKLAANQELSIEQKESKREILLEKLDAFQQQYTQRQNQLREEQREKMQEKSSAQSNMDKNPEELVGKLPSGSMRSLLDADQQLTRALATDAVKSSLTRRAIVVSAELKLDKENALDIKREELSELKLKISSAGVQSAALLGKANRSVDPEKDNAVASSKKENASESSSEEEENLYPLEKSDEERRIDTYA